MPTILDTALQLHELGYSVLPIKPDGSKMPAIPWKTYQQHAAPIEQVQAWFEHGPYDIGVATGAVSGNLEMLEIEGRAATALPAIKDAMETAGHAELWQQITTAWLEMSPSGGYHFHYRLQLAPDESMPGNTKIARDADKLVLAETRSEGGQTVIAPSTHHPTGRPWQRLVGSPEHVPTITMTQRDQLHAVLRQVLHVEPETPTPAASSTPPPAPPPRAPEDGMRPGDDYNQRATWDEILIPHGWTKVHPSGAGWAWTRPGKNPRDGISATTGTADSGDRLYVFSSSTPFDPEVPYSKLGALAVLEYDGDHSAAAKELARRGYGTPKTPQNHSTDDVEDWTGLILPEHLTNGSTALDTNETTDPTLIINYRATRTDVGNSQLLVAHHSDQIRYVAQRGKWLTWDGTRWATDELGNINELAKQIILDMNTRGDKEAAQHRTRSLSRRSIEAMVALARTDPAIAVSSQSLDAHPYHLCTPGGVVNLRDGTITPPNPDDLHTRITGVTPNPDCPTPQWDRFLEQTFLADPELIEFVQRLAGYSALGIVLRHILPFLVGPGGNGKGVLLDVLRAVLGEYATTTPAKFLMAGVTRHETEIARLSGMRLVIASEVNEEDRFDEAKMKLLTGGDALTARFMKEDYFTFVPTHSLWLMGNHQPKVTSGGNSFWRRLRLIDFKHTVAKDQIIDGLEKILVNEEGPGILHWIIQGAVKFLAGGLDEPAAVMLSTELYAAEEDHLARFLEDRIQLGGGSNVRENTTTVRAAYESWCRQQGERAMSPQAFGRELRTRFQIEQVRSHGARYYTGLMLLADENEPDEPDEWWNQ